MKKGFTLVEIMISVAILSLLTISIIPFIVQTERSREIRIEEHNKVIEEYNQINTCLSAKTYSELIRLKGENIKISKVSNGERLYLIEGKNTKTQVYIVLKE